MYGEQESRVYIDNWYIRSDTHTHIYISRVTGIVMETETNAARSNSKLVGFINSSNDAQWKIISRTVSLLPPTTR